MLLGEGREGRVFRRDGEVLKIFKDGVISDEIGGRLVSYAKSFRWPFPENVSVQKDGDNWIARYPWFESDPVDVLSEEEVTDYLVKAGGLSVIADNFKLANLRRRNGRLVYIDIGRHIRPFNRSTFRDVCAKAFLLLNGFEEDRLVREFGKMRERGDICLIPGFTEFYERIVMLIAEDYWKQCPRIEAQEAQDTTLLIKCCAMDYIYLERQVAHIVSRLSFPRKFKEVLLSVDTRKSGFLRQHLSGDLEALVRSAQRLCAAGMVDRVIVAPEQAAVVRDINKRWFGMTCEETHTASSIPVCPQLWAFERVTTPYVLQADCDVMIHRDDFSHDFLSEMIQAHEQKGVMGVGFNIPQSCAKVLDYDAPEGEYKPEVRLGLFNLRQFKETLPWPNRVVGNNLKYGWYQSLHQALKLNGWRCVRGGDPRTAYIHPLNSAKTIPGLIEDARRFIESGVMPAGQSGKWDLVEDVHIWDMSFPAHELVVLLEPVHASRETHERLVRSCVGQIDNGFTVAVLDDANRPIQSSELVSMLGVYGIRPQVVSSKGGIARLIKISRLVLRMKSDEAFMSAEAVMQLKMAIKERGTADGACFCDSKGLRDSIVFGLGKIYGGATSNILCSSARCLRQQKNDMLLGECTNKAPDCRTFDAFTEVPPDGSNLKPHVMAGFVVWRSAESRTRR